MMEGRDSLVDLERRRQQLENNIAKLQASLGHWQQWEVEYESMKEELLDPGQRKDLQILERPSQNDLFDDSKENFLNEKERKLLIYDGKGQARSAKDIVGLLLRRIDYVQQMVKSIMSLLDVAERKLAASTVLPEPEVRNEEGLPLTEVHEELDEDGNVISSTTSQPGQESSAVMKAIHKAGVEYSLGKQPSSGSGTSNEPFTPLQNGSHNPDEIQVTLANPVQLLGTGSPEKELWTSDSHPSESETAKHKRPRTKKRVSFADGTKPEDDPSEHPIQMPKEEQIQCIQSTCLQLRQQLGKRIVERKLNALPDAPSGASDTAVAYQILRLQQNRQTKRLLKACQLDLQGAAMVLCAMAETNDHDLESPLIASVIRDVRYTRSSASSSRDSPSNAYRVGRLTESDINKHYVNVQIQPQRIRDPQKPATEIEKEVKAETAKLDWSNKQSLLDDIFHAPDSDEPLSTGDPANRSGGSISSPTVPEIESPEEAALRRQMLQYNMNEVGSVVAELEVEDDIDEDDDIDTNGDTFIDYDSADNEDEEEDEHGRTVSQVLSADYLAEMKALEEKLKAKMAANADPDTAPMVALNRSANGHMNANSPEKQRRRDNAKGVRFAGEIDVKEIPANPHVTAATVVERKASQPNRSATAPRTSMSSRFKADGATNGVTAESTTQKDDNLSPTPPVHKNPLGARPILEREINRSKPSQPDDLEPAFHHAQVRNEYHRLRNRMIASRRGFTRPDEPEEEPKDGGKKMSRFRAARLGLQ